MNCGFIFWYVKSWLFFKFFKQKSLNNTVYILSTTSCIAIRSFDFNYTLADFQNWNVECSSSKIVNCNSFIFFLLHTKCHCRSGRLVDDSLYFKPSNLASIFCCLTLRVIEISRYCDNSSIYSFSEITFRCLFHFHKHKSSDLRWGVIFPLDLNPCVSTWVLNDLKRHVLFIILDSRIIISSSYHPFRSKYGILWIGDGLSFGWCSHELFTFLCKGNNWWCCSITLGILEDFWSTTLHNGNTRICGTEINTYDGSFARGAESMS